MATPEVKIYIGRKKLLVDGRLRVHEAGELEIWNQRLMVLLFTGYYLGSLHAL